MAAIARPVEEITEAHPLLDYLASLSRIGVTAQIEKEKGRTDIVLGTLGSSTFACAIEPDGSFALGVPERDLPKLMSVTWASAALIRGLNDRDFIALSCRDLGGPAPQSARLFLNVTVEVADIIAAAAPLTLRLRPMRVVRGTPMAPKGGPSAEMKFSVIGA